MTNRFPASLKSKFFTGSFEVAPQGTFWTSLYGKEMHRFCNLSIEELRDGFAMDKVFYPDGPPEEIQAILDTRVLAEMCGHDTWATTPDKAKERILAYTFPIILPVRKVEFLRRYATTKAQIASKNATEAVWPMLDLAYNAILLKHYHQPPRDMKMLKEFWTGLAGKTLHEPTLCSKDYRTQAIEAMDEQAKVERLPQRHWDQEFSPIVVNGYQIEHVLLIGNNVMLDPSGAQVKISEGYDQFFPVEICGPPKKVKKKDLIRQQAMKRSELSKVSKHYFAALKKKGLSSDLMLEVRKYLQGFVNLQIQEMAAKIIYVTSEITVHAARQITLNEDSDDASDSSDSDDEKVAEEGNNDESMGEVFVLPDIISGN